MPLLRCCCIFVLSSVFLGACTSTPKKHDVAEAHVDNANTVIKGSNASQYIASGYVCKNAYQYKDRSVGTGHCVSLIQICSGAPRTAMWKQGALVKGAELTPGTIIATFKSGKYPNVTGWHAAIYISQDENGIWVWDQWVGKPVHKRLIRFKNGNGKASNDGDAYSVVY